MQSKKIVIVGSSYSSAAVFNFLQNYISKSRQPFDLVLISDRTYYYFGDLLPDLLKGEAGISEIAEDFRSICYIRPGISFIKAKVLEIDFQAKTIETTKGSINYDYLVLSPKNDEDDFSLQARQSNFFPFHTPEDVVKIQNHINSVLEDSTTEKDINIKRILLTFSIIEAKERGIELVLSLVDYINSLLVKKYPEIKNSFITINLIDLEKSLGMEKSPFYNNYLFYDLNKKNVKIITGLKVKEIADSKVILENGEEILSSTIIFSGRYRSCSLFKSLDITTDVISKTENVYSIGETSLINTSQSFEPSILFYKDQAKHCAESIISKLNNNAVKPFKNNTQLKFLSVGKRKSIVNFNNFHFSGFLAWVIYRLLFIKSFLSIQKRLKSLIKFFMRIFGLTDNDITLVSNQEIKIIEKNLMSQH